jgi:HK97 family phage prohead protease/HK97 family phage major capsid protein
MLLNKAINGSVVSTIKTLVLDSDEDLIIEGYANTVSKDRAGDVIPSDTWKTGNALNNYMKNPILLAFHNHSMPIGKALEVSVTEFGLYIKAKISKGAGNVYQLIKDGILSTFSVGFRIYDAEYDPKSDTYFIKDVELTEVSVVSVPCNQDSIFSVAKSMESSEYADFKKNFNKPAESAVTKENKMEFNLEDFKSQILNASADAATKAVEAAEAKKAADAKAAADALAAAKAQDVNIASKATEAAKALVDELKKSLNEKDNAFAEAVKKHNDELIALKDEIAQVVASRGNPLSATAIATAKALSGQSGADATEVDRVVMLGMVKNLPMFETKYGKNHQSVMKAVNNSSSIQVSSESYETVFSTNLIRDIQAKLVVAPIFREIPMTSKQLTIPINPGRGNATWVDSADFGTDDSSGGEVTVALTERTLKTFKLAAKTYLTEETEEDAIIAVLPILRDHLVEAHANSIDLAFLRGTGTGQPKGLITQATAIAAGAAVQVTTATHTGTVTVTAKEILKARRKLGLYGINLNEIVLVISQDAYWDLLLDDEWADVQQVGMAAATKLQGEVGNIYGMPVVVSNQFAAKAASASFGVMVNKNNFVVPRQRGATVKTDFDVEKDRRVIVATQRLNLEPLIEASAGNGKGVVSLAYAA